MTKPWGLYVLLMDRAPEFVEVLQEASNDRFGCKFGKYRRLIEELYVTDDCEVQLLTWLYAEDHEGIPYLEKPRVPRVNPWVPGLPPNVPFLRGTAVIASYLQAGDGKELPLNVATLYDKRGIEAIVNKPSPLLRSMIDDIPCNMP